MSKASAEVEELSRPASQASSNQRPSHTQPTLTSDSCPIRIEGCPSRRSMPPQPHRSGLQHRNGAIQCRYMVTYASRLPSCVYTM